MSFLALPLLVVPADLVHRLDQPDLAALLLLVLGSCRLGVDRLHIAEPYVGSRLSSRQTASGVLLQQTPQQVSGSIK